VEKILGKDEPLPGTWPVQGTTGYDFINLVNGLFVQRSNERAFSDLYNKISGRKSSYADTVYASKQLIMRVAMASQINVLGHRLDVLSERDRRSRDFTLNNLRNAIREIIACFPVYRTYVTDGPEPITERDREYIHLAVARAKRRNQALSGQVFDFIRSILLKQGDARKPEDRDEQIRFVMKFQQITSPVTAKGVEDTALYRFNRLVSLNEVGGEPDRFGVLLEEFHKQMQERRARWPYALSASSTHDTKRSEDVRARINVLSEMPAEWKTKVRRWNQLNQKHRREVEGERLPNRNDEYLFYQTLIGTWPMHAMGDQEYREYCSRIQQYMEKAIREAKDQTSWVNPNVVYDQAVHDFIERALDRTPANAFLQEFVPFQERIAHYGLFNSLAQVMLKITAPGIPDFYQGTELWDFSLVDPDNRRPVDYTDRFKLLQDLRRSTEQQPHRAECVLSMANHARDGRLKLYAIMTGLDFRRAHADLFQQGEYLPLETGGIKKQHICAFARLFNSHAAITVVPRLLGTLTQDVKNPPIGPAVWEDTWIAVPPWPTFASYRNLMTGEVLTTESASGHRALPMGLVFGRCPIALLERL
jgi:(1->4)-alpha-D-glucan 1-alpha-D-glucosylmutase